MNILLIRPRADKKTITVNGLILCEPLELEYLSAYLEQFGHSVTIVDMMLEKRPLTHFLRHYRPELVGFTAYLTHVHIVKAYAAQVKAFDSGITTVVGGVHAEVCPEDFADVNIDYVAGRNGMKTMQAIIDGTYTGPDDHVEPVFDYPFPDRTKTARYRKHYRYLFHDGCAIIKTAQGCPFKCSFCFGTQITQGQYFQRDIANVVAELKTITEKNIFIADDTFLYDRERVEKFCDLLKAENINKHFVCFGRTDFVVQYPETIEKFKEAGFRGVFLGIESFSDKDLKSLNKETTAATNVKAIKFLDELGILYYCGMIVHYNWSRADFDRLLKDVRRFKHIMVNLQPLTPMPGTQSYRDAFGKLLITMQNPAYWGGGHVLMQPEKMSIGAFYYNILRIYFKTGFRLRMHFMVLKQYGIAAYWRAARASLHVFRQYVRLILQKHDKPVKGSL